MSNITIRQPTTFAEIKAVEQVQLEIWQIDHEEAVPFRTLHATQDSGAALFAAFDGDKVVGFVYGVLGMRPKTAENQLAVERLKMYSVMAGVLSGYQGQDIGYRLKLAQRDYALSLGLTHMTWTYDPLLSLNGRFNIHKLGAVCQRYRRNFHGEMGGINAGLSSDRFEVDWWLDEPHVHQRLEAKGQKRPFSPSELPVLNPARLIANGHPQPTDASPSTPEQAALLVEIPAQFNALKTADISLAKAWRTHTGALFETLFDYGYVAVDFIHSPNHPQRSFYLLQKDFSHED